MTTIEDPRFEGSVRLRDGRRLGFAEFGPRGGLPLLWFHGTPGARRQIAPDLRTLARQRGVRLVGVERPGIGDSTPHAYRRVVDFAADIEQVCNALEIDRFAVAGLSGGGPYALACAHEMSDRVVAVAVLGGVVPAVGRDAAEGGANAMMRATSPLFDRGWPALGVMMKGLVRLLESRADEALDLFARTMPPGDRAVFDDPAIRRMFIEDLLLASRENMSSLFLDTRLFGRGWGFHLRDVRVPALLRYGDADTIVPLAHGEHLAKHLPGAELRVYPGEGHIGSFGASAEILEYLLERWETGGR